MFLYAYKGKFVATDESLELTEYGDGSPESLLAHRAGQAALWKSWSTGWNRSQTNTMRRLLSSPAGKKNSLPSVSLPIPNLLTRRSLL